jgi:hypothetical protein
LLKELIDWQKNIKAPVPKNPNPEYIDIQTRHFMIGGGQSK